MTVGREAKSAVARPPAECFLSTTAAHRARHDEGALGGFRRERDEGRRRAPASAIPAKMLRSVPGGVGAVGDEPQLALLGDLVDRVAGDDRSEAALRREA